MVNATPPMPQQASRARPGMTDEVDALLIGSSPAMQQLRALVRRAGPSQASVLVHGPSGAGKEVVARALHAASGRSGPMVAVNCGAIPAELIESELFGHEKGAFTGAVAQRRGRFEQAQGGTLFLDEIGDMPAAAQVRLLRVLEERVIERVGGHAPIAVDCRIICATHRNLPQEIRAGRFREDLWFRLSVLPVSVAPLRDRAQDIPQLLSHLSSGCATPAQFAPDALALLRAQPWPGNVRELRNLVERAAILHPQETLDAAATAQLLGVSMAAPACTAMTAAQEEPTGTAQPLSAAGIDLRAMLCDVEKRHLLAALGAAHGVVADAARLVGMGRTTFIDKMKRHAITKELAA